MINSSSFIFQFQSDTTVTESKEEKITKDLTKLSKREKIQVKFPTITALYICNKQN